MHKISREEFLKVSALGFAASFVPPSVWSENNKESAVHDQTMFKRLLKSNDISAARYLESSDVNPRMEMYRMSSEVFAILTASYCQPDSNYYRSHVVLTRLETMISKLLQAQYPNGTLDSSGNRQSPPDTAFLLEPLCSSALVLNQQEFDELDRVKEELRKFLLNAGEALRTGGVHTPNHRWVVSSALARLHSVFHDNRYVGRIDEWLAEGIDINAEGQYSERSRLYSAVIDNSLLTIGRILNRPSLFEIVRRNLASTYYYMETNGELVTMDSRRQDQSSATSMTSYYLFYRYFAIYYNDEVLAAIANEIESFQDFERIVLSRSLIHFMENPLLGNELRTDKTLQTDYSKLFTLSGLARIRRGTSTASIFGGTDKPVIIASGRSSNPSFFAFRKGSAILDYARLSASFFDTGYFRSDGVTNEGNKYTLHEKKEAYYYHPMPDYKRNVNGDYKLTESLDGRFWSKMDFESRPTTTVSLETLIVIEEENGTFTMDCEVNGSKDVEVTLEFCFRSGGKLEGVAAADDENYFLKDGYAKYIVGNDIIEIGPGIAEHNNIRRIEGEEYSTRFGTIKGKGMHVYLTGHVPFKHSITIK